MYFERQSGSDTCRLHAANNALQRQFYSSTDAFVSKFQVYYERDVAPSLDYVVEDGHISTTFAIEIATRNLVCLRLWSSPVSVLPDADCYGCIPYTATHVWALLFDPARRQWTRLDSMHPAPQVVADPEREGTSRMYVCAASAATTRAAEEILAHHWLGETPTSLSAYRPDRLAQLGAMGPPLAQYLRALYRSGAGEVAVAWAARIRCGGAEAHEALCEIQAKVFRTLDEYGFGDCDSTDRGEHSGVHEETGEEP